MKEQGPRPIDLTNQANPHRLEVRGDIFMPEGGEGSKPDLKGAKFRQGLRESRLGEALGFKKPPRGEETPASPPGGDGGGRREPPAPPSGFPEPGDRGGIPVGGITRPDFKAILGHNINPRESFALLQSQHTKAFQDLLSKLDAVPESDVAQRAKLSSELERLATEYEAARQLLIMTADIPERGIDERDKRELDEVEGMAAGDERGERIRRFMKEYIERVSPEDEPLPDRVLKLIALDDSATEEFISRLIVSELENEGWQIKGFYGNINFEKFIRVTQKELSGARRERLKYLIDANSSFHNMNYILKRNFEQFSQQSEAILPQHLEVLANIPGVATALSLYEELYAAALSKETRVTEKSALEIDKKVEEELRVQALTMKGIAGGTMEDWEVRRAYIYSRNFFRITVRAAEHTTLSELPRHDDPLLFVSSPQAKLTQVLNVLKFVGFRFRPEEQMGGPELLDRTLANNKKARQKRGVRIKTLQGTDVDMREFQSIVGARGVFATWRNAEAVLRGLRFMDTGEIPTDAVQFFLDHNQEIEGLKERSEKKPTGKAAEDLKDDTERLFKPLLDSVSISLGILASPSGLSNVTPEFKQLVWERIVALDPLVVASLLTRLQMDGASEGMHFIQEDKNAPEIQALEDILLSVWGKDAEKAVLWGTGQLKARNMDGIGAKDLSIRELRGKIDKYLDMPDSAKTAQVRKEIDDMRVELGKKEAVLKQVLESEKWQELTRKLRTAHRLRMNEEEERIRDRQQDEKEEQFKERIKGKPKTLDDFLKGDLVLTPDEQAVVNAINKNGREIAGDLAKIKQTSAWFLDDVPFKTLEWTRLGQFYDRETGDLGNFNKAAGALLKIISNPFGRPPEAVLKDLAEAVGSASMVLGRGSAQNNQQPILEAYLEMIYEKPRFRQIAIEAAAHAMHHPTSRAQEIAGMDAPAVTEDGMLTILEHSLKDGIVRKNVKDAKGNAQWDGTFEKLKKKFHATQLNVFWGKIRDFGPLGILAFLIQFFNSIGKNK